VYLNQRFAGEVEMGRGSLRENMDGMGMVSRAIDKLPTWVQVILMVSGVVGCVYGIAHYGWSFILRVIFTPDL